MSLEFHVFMRKGRQPTREAWQSCIQSGGYPVELDPELDLSKDTGFSPTKLNGNPSGFEIYPEDAQELLTAYADIQEQVGSRDFAVSFRWGGDASELKCVFCAAAALAEVTDGVGYYADGAILYSPSELAREAKELLEQE